MKSIGSGHFIEQARDVCNQDIPPKIQIMKHQCLYYIWPLLKEMKKFVQQLNMRFFDNSMEEEYMSIQNRSQMTDFQITMLTLILVTLVTLIRALILQTPVDIAIIGVTIGIMIIIYFMKGCFPRKINYLILLAIFIYNCYRLFYLVDAISRASKTVLFNAGYTYAALQMILFSRIHNIYYRLFGVIFCYLLRFGIIIGFIEQSSVDIATLIRNFIVDAFIIYCFYSQEKTSRRIFKDFCFERDELRKFKDLLEDYLTESVLVLDLLSQQPLFFNKTFHSTFKFCSTKGSNDNNFSINSPWAALSSRSPNILNGLLRVEKSSLREIGSSNENFSSLSFSATLGDVIQVLLEKRKLYTNAFSLTAYYDSEGETKSFKVILNRISWDRSDAIALILHDITDQERVTNLRLANQHKDKIIATVSHELRTPLNGIIGLLDMAAEKTTHPDAQSYISLSKDNANLLLSLVNSHLDLQQIRAGRLRINPSRINIAKILNDVIQLLQFQTKHKGIYLKADIKRGVSTSIVTDEGRLKQILINLIGNAVKFTSSGGITIEVCPDQEDERCLQFSVIDTGIGIKDEDLGKLFQMYGRLEEERNINKNGVGLGLVISNVLAKILGGKSDEKGVEVKSQYGVGTTFFFKIRKDLRNLSDSDSKQKIDSKQQMAVRSQNDIEESMMDCEEFLETTKFEANDVVQVAADLQIRLTAYTSEKKIKMGNKDSKSSMRRCLTAETNKTRLLNSSPELKESYILVVDDNPFNILVVSNLLKDLGIPLKTAMNGPEAIQTVKDSASNGEAIKVILMDCHMPVMDGYETSCHLIKMMENNQVPAIPILALTAGVSEEDILKCKKCGMKGYLTKPLSKEILLKELNNLEQ